MNKQVILDSLNDLIKTSRDGEYGFRTCSEQASSPALKTTLAQRADACRDAAVELQGCVQGMGGEAEQGGSATGAMHRGWVAIKTMLSSYDDLAVLEEVERGEDRALTAYRDAMRLDLPTDVRAVVERQLAGAKLNHDQMRALRDQHRAAKAAA